MQYMQPTSWVCLCSSVAVYPKVGVMANSLGQATPNLQITNVPGSPYPDWLAFDAGTNTLLGTPPEVRDSQVQAMAFPNCLGFRG